MSTHEPRLTGTKACTKCERELPVICFAVVPGNKDGLKNQCRECDTVTSRKSYVKKKKNVSVNIMGYHRFHNNDTD